MALKKQVLARSIIGEVHMQKGGEPEVSSLLTHIIPVQILYPFLKLDLVKWLRDLVCGYLQQQGPPVQNASIQDFSPDVKIKLRA